MFSPLFPIMLPLPRRSGQSRNIQMDPVTEALTGPAVRLYSTPAQVIQLWVRAKGAVVVTTTSKEERLKEYLGIEALGLCFCL